MNEDICTPQANDSALMDQLVHLQDTLNDQLAAEGVELPSHPRRRDAAIRQWLSANPVSAVHQTWRALDAARWQLALSERGLVRALTSRYRRRANREDLTSAAWIGLYQAACTFNPARGVRFSTWARWSVRSELSACAERNGLLVRVPTTTRRRMQRLRRNLPVAQCSLDDTDASGRRVEDRLAAASVDPGEAVDRARQRLLVKRALKHLDPRDRHVLSARLGTHGRPASFKQIGRQMGVSGERARQLFQRALKRARAHASA